MTEMHFHFFVMLGVISLYQDWRPFLALDRLRRRPPRASSASLEPGRDVFADARGVASPLQWAGDPRVLRAVHVGGVVASWRIIEDSNRRVRATPWRRASGGSAR